MIKFSYGKATYYAGAINNSLGLRTLAKFDSGASVSIIGLARFDKRINNIRFMEEFVKYAQKHKVVKEEYTVANGQTIATYPCIMNSISVDGTIINNFMFRIILDGKVNKFLIGDDFISCCKFDHEIGGAIEISEFSQSRYDIKHNKEMINLKEVFKQFTNEEGAAAFVNQWINRENAKNE